MANCTKYQRLLPRERAKFIGELTHACQNDNKLFQMGKEIIRLAEEKGLFEGVVILPEGTDSRVDDNFREIID